MPAMSLSPKVEELVGEYKSTRWSSADKTYLVGYLRDETAVVGHTDPSKLLPGVTYRFIG